MKAEPRQTHITQPRRNIQDFHNISDALDLVVTELTRVVVSVEALQPAMAYRVARCCTARSWTPDLVVRSLKELTTFSPISPG